LKARCSVGLLVTMCFFDLQAFRAKHFYGQMSRAKCGEISRKETECPTKIRRDVDVNFHFPNTSKLTDRCNETPKNNLTKFEFIADD